MVKTRLEEMAEHIAYEVYMLKETAFLLQYETCQIIKNCFEESFVIHCRNVIDFFDYKEKNPKVYKSDIKFYDFMLCSKKWSPEQPHSFDIKMVLNRCNKQVAHLSRARSGLYNSKELKRWSPNLVNSIACFFCRQWELFLEHLTEKCKNYFGKWIVKMDFRDTCEHKDFVINSIKKTCSDVCFTIVTELN